MTQRHSNITLKDYENKFLPFCNTFKTLNGSDVKEWLESIGEKVIMNKDTGRNGIAITESGYCVSTNNYVYKVAN